MKKKDELLIGTIGHVNSGRFTLSAAILKILKEEGQKVAYKPYDSVDIAKEK